MAQDYISWIRSKVGHDRVIMVACAGLIVNVRDEILLVRRKDEEQQWALPGGYMEAGETPQVTVTREVLEESGLNVSIGELIDVYSKDIEYNNGDKVWLVTLVYRGRALSEVFKPDNIEISDARFFPATDLPTNIRNPEFLAAIRNGASYGGAIR